MYMEGQTLYPFEDEYTEKQNRHGETTAFQHCFILCELWFEKYPSLLKVFPPNAITEACHEYDVLHAIEKFIGTQVNDKWAHLKKQPMAYKFYYEKIRNYMVEHESTIISAITETYPKGVQLSLLGGQ